MAKDKQVLFKEKSKLNIQDIIEILKIAPRIGSEFDIPEGTRYIQISETLINQIIDCLTKVNRPSYTTNTTTTLNFTDSPGLKPQDVKRRPEIPEEELEYRKMKLAEYKLGG